MSLAVTVQPAEARSPQEIEAFWLTRETAYARVHVVEGTAAARDFEFLITVVDAAIQQAARRLNETPLEKFDVYLIDRVIGQGGYAGSAMVVSYLDRDYAGDGLYEVLGHEAVHMIDRQIAPNRIPFLGEGVAVWATGGHYKQEDLARRTAALLVTGHYIPLADLLDDFYKTQHEIGYLEAAGLVQYLVDSAGWPRFRAFYAGFTVREGESASGAFAREVQRHYGLSLSQLEEAWLTEISQIRLQRQDIEDLQTTLRFYEIMRQYQLAFDPTAHFLQAWLPFPAGAHERGLTADFIRHPSAETNVTLETLLAAADRALRAGNYGQANVLLDSVERVVESRGTFLDPLAISYRQLVRSAARSGYEAQQIDLQGSQATMVATESGTNRVTQLRFQLGVAGWELAPMSSQ